MNSTKASVRVGFVFGTTCLAFCAHAAAIKVVIVSLPDSATVAVLEEPMASSVTALPQGVIAMIGRNQPIPQEVLDHPYVTGILIRNWWPDAEPQEGVFDWSYFD